TWRAGAHLSESNGSHAITPDLRGCNMRLRYRLGALLSDESPEGKGDGAHVSAADSSTNPEQAALKTT
ncbi:MAG: hypothetical protein ACPG8N_08625, partial [Rhodothermales bacterium]